MDNPTNMISLQQAMDSARTRGYDDGFDDGFSAGLDEAGARIPLPLTLFCLAGLFAFGAAVGYAIGAWL